MADELSVKGLEQLRKNIQGVTDDMQLKGGRFALRKAANIIRDQAKANALRLDDPETAEKIADNVSVRWSSKTFKRTGNLGFRVGVAAKGKGGDTFYWRFLEFGTERQAATPFLRHAAASKAQDAVDEFIKQYGRALARHLAKAKKAT